MISLQTTRLRVAVLTFSILCLELALIRWTSGQIRVFAYFNNIVLIGAFLGLGVGTALGRNGKSYLACALPVLLLVCVPLGLAEELGLVHMVFPDQSVALWGGEAMAEGSLPLALNIILFLLVWLLVVAVFVCLGSELGCLFSRARDSLKVYAWDLIGSFFGIAAFTALTYLNTPPAFWLTLGAAPLLLFQHRALSLAALGATLILAWHSAGEAVYSPYNRIDVAPWQAPQSYELQVNRDFHQYMHNLNDEIVATSVQLARVKEIYDLPFRIAPGRASAIIVGAGSGNDTQAAIRSGVAHILAVDIDPRIIELGYRLHPEQPYQQPQAIPIVQDARAFFSQYQGPPVDIVSYGLLDSHAMSSAMSTLRIDNFVYTEEGIRDAWSHVGTNGVLAISFSLFSGAWIGERIYWTLAKATGRQPIALFHGMHNGATFIVARNPASLDAQVLAEFPSFEPGVPEALTRTTSDNWPYLYIRPGTFPWLYVLVITFILLLAGLTVPVAFGGAQLRDHFDPVLFLMGAAFLLLETRGVTSLSLLFGSTWLVNSAIFGGIVFVALMATLTVARWRIGNPGRWLFIAAASCLFLYWFDIQRLNEFSLLWRGVIGGLLHALPVFFAALVFPTILARAKNAAAALGSNLLGAVLGGCLEYLSMLTGLRSTAGLAMVLYLLALMLWQRNSRQIALARGAIRS